MKIDLSRFEWTREPAEYTVADDCVTITTQPGTDLWQRTFYGFRNDNAPVFQMRTEEQYFSFVVRTEFEYRTRFDQCGVAMYLDSDNWLKASIEFENGGKQMLGCVATNNGYSDWSTTEISDSVKSMWYRFSRRASDFKLECSEDGVNFRQMRICHMWKGDGEITFGIYACSPGESSFEAKFYDMEITECKWEKE